MSMNFAREQSLLRQKLAAKGSPELAAQRQQQHGGALTFLGTPDAEIAAAASTLAATYPQMGRAQMTAFVRTLWNSKIHELRAVGVQLLAARATLLEAADLPLLEGFAQDPAEDAVHRQLAHDVIGTLVARNKKLWKVLERHAGGAHAALRLASLRAAARALADDDDDGFARFTELATPLLATAEPALQAAIDEALVAAAPRQHAAVTAFAQQHQRRVTLPAAAAVTPPGPAADAAPAAAVEPIAKLTKKAPAKRPAKPAAPAKKPAAKPAAKAPAKSPAKPVAKKKPSAKAQPAASRTPKTRAR